MSEYEEFTAALHRLWRNAGRPAITELARKTNLSRNYLSQVLHGQLHGSWLTVTLIVVAMGGDPEEIEPLYRALPAWDGPGPPTNSETTSIAAFLTIAAALGQAQAQISEPGSA